MKLIIDTREKKPWDLSIYGLSSSIICLSTGDYTLEGLEDIFRIERKKSPSEMAGNLGRKKNQFKAELVRMEEFRFRYLICEFSSDDLMRFPYNMKIPSKFKKKIRVSGVYMSSALVKLCAEHGIELIFCDGREEAEKKANEIIREVTDIVKREARETRKEKETK